jgi:hypothetical protein
LCRRVTPVPAASIIKQPDRVSPLLNRHARSPLLFGRRGVRPKSSPRCVRGMASPDRRGAAERRKAQPSFGGRRPRPAVRGPKASGATPCGAPPRMRVRGKRKHHPLAAFEMPGTRADREREVWLGLARTNAARRQRTPAGFRPPFLRSVPRRKRHPPLVVADGATPASRERGYVNRARRRRIPPRCTTPHEAPLADRMTRN